MNCSAKAFVLLGFVAATIAAADADERFSTNGNDPRPKLDAYSRAVKLPTLALSDHDELRIWVADVMFSRVWGYVTDGKTSRECQTTYRWGTYTATVIVGHCVDTTQRTKFGEAFALLDSLAKLHGLTINCGVMDGVSVDVEGRTSGQVFALSAGNPQSCPDEASKLVERTLQLLDPAQQPAT